MANVKFNLMNKNKSKLSSTIIASSGIHTITDDTIMKIPVNRYNVTNIKKK